jgi:hypothetical protein
MQLGIMQPYFFPYLGYFQLIEVVDKWIVFDTPQYIRHGWVNRNRIMKFDGNDWMYINVPLQKHSRDTAIKDVLIASNTQEWQEKIYAQLLSYRKKAPHFSETMDVVTRCFNAGCDGISGLNIVVLKEVCAYLEIDFRFEIYSQMNLKHEPANDAGEWALQISKACGADTYINPPGGREIFDPSKFKAAGINLRFLESELKQYNQRNGNFIAGLSVLDVMMFNSRDEIKELLSHYRLVS